MRVRLTHLDGSQPNVALMKLAHWHRAQGDEVHLSRTPTPSLFEGQYDRVYGSAIFAWSGRVIRRLKAAYPDAIVGGTGVLGPSRTVEDIIGEETYEHFDYSIYPEYRYSLGFTQRGCRPACRFCVVPGKEGKVKPVNTIEGLWRPGKPKAVLLLDNDFFGQDVWKDRIEEIREGKFRVSFNQGINIRLLTEEEADALASIEYRDDDFKRRRLYTAWDNLKDEGRFFEGLRKLNAAGIPSKQVMVYMLVGYRKGETMEEVLHRFNRIRATGCKPYPMVFERWRQPTLRRFARWAIGRYYEIVSWAKFKQNWKAPKPASLPMFREDEYCDGGQKSPRSYE